MNAFAKVIVDELRALCGDLIETGLAPSGGSLTGARTSGPATFSMVLRQVDALAGIIPELIKTLEAGESQVGSDVLIRRTPSRASMPRAPSAWEHIGSRMLPRYWERVIPLPEPDVAPLGYVTFILTRLTETFSGVRGRLRRHIEEARASRDGTSRFAREDLNGLLVLDGRLDRADTLLLRGWHALQRVTGSRVPATDRLPHPYPRSPEWTAFRRLADSILRPEQFLPDFINSILHAEPEVADLPFLYQRWVGMRVLRALSEDHGFTVQGQSIGPIFLGGCVRLQRGLTSIDLWCEPRLSSIKHPSGLAADGAEATPDYVVVTTGQGGPDAFVLDATLTHDPTVLEAKTRYRERITFQEFRSHAGVPGRHRPLRAWAAAPISGAKHNRLSRPDGSGGVVPMHPGGFAAGPLNAWISDIVDHGDAWQLLASRGSVSAGSPHA